MKNLVLSLSTVLAMTGAAFSHEYMVGDLIINHPVARATPANAPVSGGYMTITNNGSESDRLEGASVDFAGKTEIHEMKMDGDVMKMRKLEDGLEIPAGQKVTLMPGGYHVMFMKLEEQLKEGEKRKASLTFQNAGTVEVEFNVESLAKIKESLGAGMKMDHSKHGEMKNEDGAAKTK